jgi:hypothetical protein
VKSGEERKVQVEKIKSHAACCFSSSAVSNVMRRIFNGRVVEKKVKEHSEEKISNG